MSGTCGRTRGSGKRGACAVEGSLGENPSACALGKCGERGSQKYPTHASSAYGRGEARDEWWPTAGVGVVPDARGGPLSERAAELMHAAELIALSRGMRRLSRRRCIRRASRARFAEPLREIWLLFLTMPRAFDTRCRKQVNILFFNSSDLCQRQQGRVRIPLSDKQQLVHYHREIGTKSRLVLVGSDRLDTTRRRLG